MENIRKQEPGKERSEENRKRNTEGNDNSHQTELQKQGVR